MAAALQLQQTEFTASANPHLLITGGVHGDEFEPMAAIRRLARLFEDPENERQLLHGRLTLVPVVNEAAFLRGHRCAEDDLDLARVCPGSLDGPPTERVAAALSELIRAADFYIDLHTGGTELAVLPMTGYTLHSNGDVLKQQRKMAQAFNLPIVWGTAATHDGRSLSVARDAQVPAIYAEYLGSATCRASGIDAYVEGCLNVMRSLDMIHYPETPSQVEHVVEDSRPDAGHMQVCNPAPISGYFEPHVTLGDRVEAGQVLGTVTDVLGRDVREVCSAQTGIVLVLRTFPRVLEGQSVGVILETS